MVIKNYIQTFRNVMKYVHLRKKKAFLLLASNKEKKIFFIFLQNLIFKQQKLGGK